MGDFGSDELAEILGGLSGDALADAYSRSGGDTARAIDLLLNESGEEPDRIRDLLTVAEWPGGPRLYSTPQASLAFIHLMTGDYVRTSGLAHRVVKMLASAKKEFGINEKIASYLSEKAKIIVTLATENALAKRAAIMEVLYGSRYGVAESNLVIEPGARVALGRVLGALSGNGLELWKFRNGLTEGRDEFDRAAAERWNELSHAVSAAALALFRSDDGVTPSDLLSAFAGALIEPALLERIIDELGWRQGLRDGFRGGANGNEWLEVLERFRAWSPKQLRKLVLLEDLLKDESAAMLTAIRAAVSFLWGTNKAEAVYGALTLLRHARWLKEWRKLLVDADEERACLEFVRGLAGGATVIAIRDKWENLPVAPGGAPRQWEFLSDRAKSVWRERLLSDLTDKPEEAKGVVEFTLSWTPKEVYADLEPMLIDLVAKAGAKPHLEAIAAFGDGTAALRAGALMQHLRLGQPL